MHQQHYHLRKRTVSKILPRLLLIVLIKYDLKYVYSPDVNDKTTSCEQHTSSYVFTVSRHKKDYVIRRLQKFQYFLDKIAIAN